MLYPTIKEQDKIHIVKDIKNCACCYRFNSDIVIKRKTLRQIKFIELGKVTCKKCVSKLPSHDLVTKIPNIFEAIIGTIKTSLDYESNHPLHTGEVTACWVYYTAINEFIRFEEAAMNSTIDDELMNTLKDAKKLCESQVKHLEAFMVNEGIPLPALPAPKPKSNPQDVPIGVKLTDDEIANGVSLKVIAAIMNAATAQAQSVRNDVGGMMALFQVEMLIFDSTLKTIMRKRGWLRVPPFYTPTGSPDK
jgi:hypothetical protein